MADLQCIAAAPDWPRYFGAPALAPPELGATIYGLWLSNAEAEKRHAGMAGLDPRVRKLVEDELVTDHATGPRDVRVDFA